MALIQTYGNWATGQIYQYTYSPKWLEKLDEYDKYPLLLFVNYDNLYRLISGINLHWLTVPQRDKLIQWITFHYPKKILKDWGKPIPFTWEHVRQFAPYAAIGWRRYFPNRIRTVQPLATTWDSKDLDRYVIHSDTQAILGVTPELIQRRFQETQARKQRAAAQKHRETLARQQARTKAIKTTQDRQRAFHARAIKRGR